MGVSIKSGVSGAGVSGFSGLSEYAGTVGQDSGSEGWPGYDGSGNGELGVLFQTLRGTPLTVPIPGDASRMLMFYNQGDPTIDFKAAILTRTDKTAAIANAVDIATGTIHTYVQGAALSATRFVVASGNQNDDRLSVYLIDLTGEEITVVDSDTYMGDTINTASMCLTKHSDTLLAIGYTDVTTDDLWVVTVSVSGDTITINTPVEVRNNITSASNCNGITALDATTGLVHALNLVTLYTISGTTPSAGDTERLDAGQADTDGSTVPAFMIGISSTKAVVVFKNDATFNAKVITNNAGTLASGAVTQLYAGAGIGWPVPVVQLQENVYGALYDSSVDADSHFLVFSRNSADDAITLIDDVVVSNGTRDTDHQWLSVFDGGSHAIYTGQDDNGTEFNCEYRILSP